MYLLDVNLLIALAWDDHVQNDRAHLWLGKLGATAFATCNTTQSGFVRVSFNQKAMKCSLGIEEIFTKLESFINHPKPSVLGGWAFANQGISLAKYNRS